VTVTELIGVPTHAIKLNIKPRVASYPLISQSKR
jgi:hypothetical protein